MGSERSEAGERPEPAPEWWEIRGLPWMRLPEHARARLGLLGWVEADWNGFFAGQSDVPRSFLTPYLGLEPQLREALRDLGIEPEMWRGRPELLVPQPSE